LSEFTAPRRPFIFRTPVVLFFSLLGAGLYALYVTLRFPAGGRAGQYVYVVPIVVPFVAFLFDRAERFHQTCVLQLALDALVTVTSIWRALGHVPYVSGHALFLTYSLLTARSRVARVAAAVVMLQVIYLKYVVWHDWVSSTGGIILGTAAAFVLKRASRHSEPPAKTLSCHTS
jgi:hypothetical protein